MTYYNTVRESGAALQAHRAVADTQEQAVLEFFEDHPLRSFTPFDVQAAVLPNSPITSVRRAMTNLTREGRLMKTEEKREGPYRHRCYCWRLRTAKWSCYEPLRIHLLHPAVWDR